MLGGERDPPSTGLRDVVVSRAGGEAGCGPEVWRAWASGLAVSPVFLRHFLPLRWDRGSRVRLELGVSLPRPLGHW